jgi:adenosylhomocysteinase
MDEADDYKVADISLAEEGALRVDWARSRMPVLALLKDRAMKEQPLAGMTVAGCLHVTKETAVLIETLAAAGAKVSWSGCNPL